MCLHSTASSNHGLRQLAALSTLFGLCVAFQAQSVADGAAFGPMPDQMARAPIQPQGVFFEPTSQPSHDASVQRGHKRAGPTPPPVDPSRPPRVSARQRQQSRTIVTPAMLTTARSISNRLNRKLRRARSFKQKQAVIKSFRLSAKEQHDVSILGFKTVTLEVGGGGNSPYLVGGALSQGVAFSVTPGVAARAVTSGGFSLGVPGAAGALRIGFWKAPVDKLASWSMGVNGSAVSARGVGVGVGVFWDFSAPPRFQGFNVGAAFSKPGGGADAGLAWTEYTGQIINTTTDAGRVITFQQTKHGKELGERCKVGADCKGYNLPVGSRKAGVACCNRVCTKTKKDYAGISWCPKDCKAGVFARPGSCR